jgi:cytidylate kinase
MGRIDEDGDAGLVIGLVGPCTSGKSLLRAKLEKLGYTVRHIAQEHSYVEDMWKKISNPDVLIFLDVSYPITRARRKWDFQEADYQEQLRRLAHARKHADIYLDTDELTPDEVLAQVLEHLSE